MAALPPYKACEASALFTRSVAYLYTLCVYRQGSVPTLWEMPRSGALLRGLQNLETPLHAQRATPTGANFLLVRKFPKGKRIVTFCGVQKVTQKARARTCKKLPVASFCASETAETGRIANGCEQGDHVSRSRQALRPRFKSPVDTVFWIG